MMREERELLKPAAERWREYEAWMLQRLEEAVRALFRAYDELRGLPKLAKAVLRGRLDDLRAAVGAVPTIPGVAVEIDEDLVIYLRTPGEKIEPWCSYTTAAKRILEAILASTPTITVVGVLAVANAISRMGMTIEDTVARLLEEAEDAGGWREVL